MFNCCSEVDLQVAVLAEGLAAVRAAEGLLALVPLDVLHQRRLVGELLPAQVAAVLPLAGVGRLVGLRGIIMMDQTTK